MDKPSGHVDSNSGGMQVLHLRRPSTTVRRRRHKPYRIGGGQPELLNSVVLFIDVLGMTSIMETSLSNEDDPHAALRHVYPALRDAGRHFGRAARDGIPRMYAATFFTDNAVIGWPIFDMENDGEVELGWTFLDCSKYQLELAQHGLFSRGGLAVAAHFQNEFAVFGPGVALAYKIESESAVYPRVVLSEKAVEMARMHVRFYADRPNAPQNMEILRGDDGLYFLNYLVASAEDATVDGLAANRPRVEVHARSVEVWLEGFGDDESIGPKYAWLADYHNYVIDVWYDGDASLKVQGAPNRHTFSRFVE